MSARKLLLGAKVDDVLEPLPTCPMAPYLRQAAGRAKDARILVVCEEAGGMGSLPVRADSRTGDLIAMVSDRREAEVLGAFARKPISFPS